MSDLIKLKSTQFDFSGWGSASDPAGRLQCSPDPTMGYSVPNVRRGRGKEGRREGEWRGT